MIPAAQWERLRNLVDRFMVSALKQVGGGGTPTGSRTGPSSLIWVGANGLPTGLPTHLGEGEFHFDEQPGGIRRLSPSGGHHRRRVRDWRALEDRTATENTNQSASKTAGITKSLLTARFPQRQYRTLRGRPFPTQD